MFRFPTKIYECRTCVRRRPSIMLSYSKYCEAGGFPSWLSWDILESVLLWLKSFWSLNVKLREPFLRSCQAQTERLHADFTNFGKLRRLRQACVSSLSYVELLLWITVCSLKRKRIKAFLTARFTIMPHHSNMVPALLRACGDSKSERSIIPPDALEAPP